jgi:hypothetical protein
LKSIFEEKFTVKEVSNELKRPLVEKLVYLDVYAVNSGLVTEKFIIDQNPQAAPSLNSDSVESPQFIQKPLVPTQPAPVLNQYTNANIERLREKHFSMRQRKSAKTPLMSSGDVSDKLSRTNISQRIALIQSTSISVPKPRPLTSSGVLCKPRTLKPSKSTDFSIQQQQKENRRLYESFIKLSNESKMLQNQLEGRRQRKQSATK